MRAYPHSFRIGIGHRVKGGSSWHSNNPLESASCGSLFRRLVSSLSLRPFWLFAPWADPTETVQCLPGRLGLLHPGFQPDRSPRWTAGYSYGATWGLAPAGLAPASHAVSFAASPSQAFLGASRVARAVARPGSHRSGLAPFGHPARQVTGSRRARRPRTCYPMGLREHGSRFRSTGRVALQRSRNPAPPSLGRVPSGRVPRLHRYYEALRFPDPRLASLLLHSLRDTATCACVLLSPVQHA